MELMPENGHISSEQLDDLVHTLASTMALRDTLHNILEAMVNAVFVISPQGMIEQMNVAAGELLGCQSDEMTDTPVARVFVQGASWMESCKMEIMSQGSIRNREIWLQRPDGQRIPVLFSASVLRTRQDGVKGFVCSAQDISEHMRLRQALQTSRESFQAIVHKSADGILIVDHAGTVCFLNPAAESLLGRGSSELIGLPFGYPLIDGDVTEVDVMRKSGELGVAEMRMVETIWNSQPSLLVSLRDVTENVRLREQLHKMSMEDALTGLNNRRGFKLLAEQQLKVFLRTGCRMSMLFIDLDHMKTINDTLGHKVGDQALLETAAVLRKVFRQSDLLARLGGDEFLVLSLYEQHVNPGATGDHVVSRLEHEVAQRNALPGRTYQLSLSIGVIPIIPTPHIDIEHAIQQADAAMYRAKMAKRAQRSPQTARP